MNSQHPRNSKKNHRNTPINPPKDNFIGNWRVISTDIILTIPIHFIQVEIQNKEFKELHIVSKLNLTECATLNSYHRFIVTKPPSIFSGSPNNVTINTCIAELKEYFSTSGKSGIIVFEDVQKYQIKLTVDKILTKCIGNTKEYCIISPLKIFAFVSKIYYFSTPPKLIEQKRLSYYFKEQIECFQIDSNSKPETLCESKLNLFVSSIQYTLKQCGIVLSESRLLPKIKERPLLNPMNKQFLFVDSVIRNNVIHVKGVIVKHTQSGFICDAEYCFKKQGSDESSVAHDILKFHYLQSEKPTYGYDFILLSSKDLKRNLTWGIKPQYNRYLFLSISDFISNLVSTILNQFVLITKAQQKYVSNIISNKNKVKCPFHSGGYSLDCFECQTIKTVELLNYFYSEIDDIQHNCPFSFSTYEEQIKKKKIEVDCLHIASHYFIGLSDYINLEIAVKKMNKNMECFKYNPISLTDTTRKFFPNIETLHLYNEKDQKFKESKISKYCILYEVNYKTFERKQEKGNDCKCVSKKGCGVCFSETNNVPKCFICEVSDTKFVKTNCGHVLCCECANIWFGNKNICAECGFIVDHYELMD